jgi:hypothetical protein
MNSRIYDLLKMFLLEDHLLRDPKQAKYISAKDPKPEKEAWRQLDAFSKDYLMVSLSTE